MKVSPPLSIHDLLARCNQIAGKTLSELANEMDEKTPASLHHAKGWIGQLCEKALGANAVNLDQPDFIDLGIELKTIPVNAQGHPRESTYICMASIPNTERSWSTSRVYRKMAKMLWVPIESSSEKPIAQLRIGTPVLWSPSPGIQAQLQQDWEELIELITLGKYDQLSATKGKYLQIRPKAANAKTFIQVIDNHGQSISIVPKGFYLRTLLTKQILQEKYVTA
ncbi:MAG: DNA mismatch repair endonuclease MutH [Candidatus Berkiella sp.]